MAVEGGCSALSLWELLIEPGSSTRLVPLINVSLVLLLVALLVVYYYFQSVHIVIMGALAIGLLASVNWVAGIYHEAKTEMVNKSESVKQKPKEVKQS